MMIVHNDVMKVNIIVIDCSQYLYNIRLSCKIVDSDRLRDIS